MKDLTIQDILGIEDKEVERVEIEKWGGNVYLRIMSAEERSELEDLFLKIQNSKKGSGLFRKELLKRTLVTSDGKTLLSDNAIADNFMSKSSLVIEVLFEKACELNAFREKDVDTLKKK